ncbi:MAG: nitrous oxide reductase family maturation protein NosD [Methanohalobium sp.]|uniref:right-handed parallel beta-helix repeat-containing protein n=1 Tax=Methanohalobium sp. TaxID=2837493 RepID=UPI00397E49B9
MKISNIYCFATTVATLIMLILILSTTALAVTHTVDDDGNKNYTTIQAAINAANDSDTIIVYNGTYKENVNVNKSVIIMSESGNPNDTRIVANDSNDHVFHITRNNVTISGFNITDASAFLNVGIFLDGVQNNNISNNELSYNFKGISLDESSNNKLINNTANSNNYYGNKTVPKLYNKFT